MIDLANIAGTVDRLVATPLEDLLGLHSRIVEAERLTRVLIREKEALARQERRLKAHGLSVVGGS
jgi:hypothetical protein